jgi:hypothetical protein
VSTIDQPLGEIGDTGPVAVSWCVAITLVGYLWATNLSDPRPAR